MAVQDNGGLAHTMTMAAVAGSAAINAGHACPSTDQRGVSRPAEGCTSGAYEYTPAGTVAAPTGLRVIDEHP